MAKGLTPIDHFPEDSKTMYDLAHRMKSRSILFLILHAAALFFLTACPKPEEAKVEKVEPVYFPAIDVCSYTRFGPGKVFANLGGGTWSPSNPTERTSSFGCTGSRPSVELYRDPSSVVEVQYSASGVEKGAALITLTYTAAGTAPIPNESTYRNVFLNLTNGIVREALGIPVPDLFKRKVSNLESYSQPGKGFAENFDIGKGFVSLMRESGGSTDVRIVVKLFPDIALKLDQ